MSTTLITGGAGFIGSHTCLELLKLGLNVCIVDSFINSSEKTITQIRKIQDLYKSYEKGILFFRKGDLKNKKFLFDVFDEFKKKGNPITEVIHFAGLKSVQDSLTYPLRYWNNNLIATLMLLETMEKFDCFSLVFSSSATIYNTQDVKKIDENCHKEPINPYGNTKFTIEMILKDLFVSNSKKWKIINLRYFNPIGAHYSGLIGENSINKPTNLLPLILKVATGEYSKLSIYGNDWPTEDGTCIRDFIHVMDLAESHIASLEFLKNNVPQIISLNIGTGKGTSVLEMVKRFTEINKVSVPYTFVDRREGDQYRLVADNSLALNLLDWHPKRSIDDMCVDSWKCITYS